VCDVPSEPPEDKAFVVWNVLLWLAFPRYRARCFPGKRSVEFVGFSAFIEFRIYRKNGAFLRGFSVVSRAYFRERLVTDFPADEREIRSM